MAEATRAEPSAETATVRLPKEMVRRAAIVAQASDISITQLLTEIIGDAVDERYRTAARAISADAEGK